jgi:Flp pilus assembly protein TadG
MRQDTAIRVAIGVFGLDTRGNFAVLTAAAISVLAASVGFAVDLAQLYSVKSGLRAALDAAVTSTARDLTTGKTDPKDAKARFETVLYANTDAGFGLDQLVLDTLAVDQAAKTVRASAHVDAELFFPLFSGGPTRRVAENSAALYSDKTIEVAMMLDITGSMRGQKIEDLKTAAYGALDAFLKDQDPKKPRVRVAIVPYADAVNTGSLADNVYVETKFTTSEPPALDDPLAASTSSSGFDGCATERKGSQQFTDASPTKAMVNRDYRLEFCPGAALKPLTANRAALEKTIDSFNAHGSTAGHIGIQWSWYMLSPKWSDVLPAASAPLAYNPKKVAKFAILMTDGEFNTAFAGVPKKGDTTGGQAGLSSAYATHLCDEMKKDGIEIFTIGFMLKEAGAKATLGDCASPNAKSVNHYYETSSGAELNAAFLDIARKIESLAITE